MCYRSRWKADTRASYVKYYARERPGQCQVANHDFTRWKTTGCVISCAPKNRLHVWSNVKSISFFFFVLRERKRKYKSCENFSIALQFFIGNLLVTIWNFLSNPCWFFVWHSSFKQRKQASITCSTYEWFRHNISRSKRTARYYNELVITVMMRRILWIKIDWRRLHLQISLNDSWSTNRCKIKCIFPA